MGGGAISPLLHTFGVDTIMIQHFALFRLVMMLFLVGLEFAPKMLWTMRVRLLGLGGLQVFVATALLFFICSALLMMLVVLSPALRTFLAQRL